MSYNVNYCILLLQCTGKKKEKGLLKTGSSKVDVLPGTLLFVVDTERHSSTSQYSYVLETLEAESTQVTCSPDQFREISKDEYELLVTVPTCNERLSVFNNTEWLKEGLGLKEGDYVDVYVKDQAQDLPGLIRYKGVVSDSKGIHFGVELVRHPGKGVTDGVFRKKQYFRCHPESAVFVGLHRIRKSQNAPKGPRKNGPVGAKSEDVPSFREYNGLSIGSRVVWMSDNGPESGMVKWVGCLPDCDRTDDITVGVEFDNPVGSGTGKYRDTRLFTAKQNHASLVPILGLIREDEFYKDMMPPPPRQATQDPAIFQFMKEAGVTGTGKTPEQVLAEQHKLIEDAQLSRMTRVNVDNNLNRGESNQKEKAGGGAIKVEAEVYSQNTKEDQNRSSLNPLYEYTRSEKEYLLQGLGSAFLTTNAGPVSSTSSSLTRQRQTPEPDPELEVGSLVEVMSNQPLYGVIRWIGHLPDQKEPKKRIAGLEMEEENSAGTDGMFQKYRLFNCPHRKGLFVPLYKCRKDKRFQDERCRRSLSSEQNFGSTETPDLPGTVSPPDSLQDLTQICGKGRGIQGHHNSCYLDASLLAMFYFTPVFDSILHRPRSETDLKEYDEVQRVLKEGIVNPLRKHHYVRADKLMKLRSLLDKVGNIPGMMSEEKDPEEFLNLLLNEVMKADPFLQISTEDNRETQQTYFYQLIMEKDERLLLPTTQQLFELSFLQLGIKLRETPSCLIIQMPRFGKDYKMYKQILPSLELDITDVLENAPRECIICGDLAAFECKECYQVHGAGLNTIAFCEGCKKTSHQHKLRINHRPRAINVPAEYRQQYVRRKAAGQSTPIRREKMELFAVICIQTSHYVSFVKGGKGKDAQWIFFDSMADRMGEQSGYNIPEIKECTDIPRWLSDENFTAIMNSIDDKSLPEHMRRLICDAYICMYQSPEVMMFK